MSEAQDLCPTVCGGGGGACAHDECVTGGALVSGCSGCVTAVCDADPYCCDVMWDAMCVAAVDQYCTPGC